MGQWRQRLLCHLECIYWADFCWVPTVCWLVWWRWITHPLQPQAAPILVGGDWLLTREPENLQVSVLWGRSWSMWLWTQSSLAAFSNAEHFRRPHVSRFHGKSWLALNGRKWRQMDFFFFFLECYCPFTAEEEEFNLIQSCLFAEVCYGARDQTQDLGNVPRLPHF